MIDISIIIFLLALIAIIVMFVSQYKKIKQNGDIEKDFPSKDFSRENFELLNNKAKRFWLIFIHGIVIIATKIWARLTHHVSLFFKKSLEKFEARIIKHEKKNATDRNQAQSIFLTTIKTYKHEIRKLKGSVEEELPRPRESNNVVDTKEDVDKMN